MSIFKSLVLFFSILVAILSILVYFVFIQTIPSPIVQLSDGKVQGIIMKSSEGREIHAYLGLPFAQPPIGSLRFKSPLPQTPWDGVWDASFNRPMCAQFDFLITQFKIGSEDCLYLNVYKPAKITPGKKLPVMAYIHGGYFHGGGTAITGPHNFMDHDVIVVVIAYRLGVLGFLNTGDDGVVRGNMGLKDQNFGLKWIQKNIKEFGGDESKVTILGESAGGASVHYQMLSPASKGLFSRAIRQSGSSLNYWTLYRNSKSQAQRFARTLNCPVESSEKMVECLRNMDVNRLLDGHKDLTNHPLPLIARFVPSVETIQDDDAFLTVEPLTLLKTGKFSQVPVLSGFCEDEGLLHSTMLWANQTKLDEVDDWFKWAPQAFHYDPKRKDVSQKLKDFYFGSPPPKNLNSRDSIKSLTNMYGDRLFNLGICQAADLEKKFVPTYMYLHGYQGGFNLGALIASSQSTIHPVFAILMQRLQFLYTTWILGEEDVKHEVPGVAHADEYPLLLWGSPIQKALFFNAKDRKVSKEMVQFWVDFALDKKPLKYRDVVVPPSNKDGPLKFLHIKYENPKIIDEPYQDRRKLWESLSLASE